MNEFDEVALEYCYQKKDRWISISSQNLNHWEWYLELIGISSEKESQWQEQEDSLKSWSSSVKSMEGCFYTDLSFHLMKTTALSSLKPLQISILKINLKFWVRGPLQNNMIYPK